MKRHHLAICFGLMLVLACPAAAWAQRLNFYLTNLTGLDIAEVYIAPTYHPEYRTGNLLTQGGLDSYSRIYIGPNYYGDQRYWNISLVWSNGHKHTFTHCRLTRYNSYTVYANSYGVKMRQGYERSYAAYQVQNPFIYSGSDPRIRVAVGPKVKVKARRKKSSSGYSPRNAAELDRIKSNFYDPNYKPKKRRTRDLVFEDDAAGDEAPPTVEGATSDSVSGETIAMKATVERTRDGQLTTVLPSDRFQSGDKVRLIFSPSRDGYVYWLAKGTTGQYQVLFPGEKTGADNKVVKNQEYTIPVKGNWRFDDNKGTETIVCILSPNRLTDLDEAVKLSDEKKGEEATKIIAKRVDGHETKRTTRDLVFEEEDEGDVNTKSQETADGEPFVAIYELEHN